MATEIKKGEKKAGSPHKIVCEKREKLEISGVLSVISFDELRVTAQTEQGGIVINGENLHVNGLNLDDGRLLIDGRVDGITYRDDIGGKVAGVFGRLFK